MFHSHFLSSDDSGLGHCQLQFADGAPRTHRQCAHAGLEQGWDVGEEANCMCVCVVLRRSVWLPPLPVEEGL